jgi:EmrB/QacA subfamily drug resistance transporter
MENQFVTDKSTQLWIVISVAFCSFMSRLNNYIVNISLPTISEYFHVGTGDVSRVVVVYLLIITSTLLLFGRLADKVGLKRIFISGYILFVAGSMLCGVSTGIHMLVAFRVVQGIGSAMLLASGYAIISKYLPQNITGWAFGITSTSSALGVATGAPLGGIITSALSWHWIFFINVPVGIIAIVVASRMIPRETREDRGPKRSFDIPGAVLSFSGLLVLLYALNVGRKLGWTSPQVGITFLTAAVLLALFIRREKTCKDPLLDLAFFTNMRFTLTIVATFMAYIMITGNAFLLPFYLEFVKGLNTKQTGLVLLTYSLIYVFLSSPAGRLADRVAPRALCSIAMLSVTFCALTFAFTLNMGGLVPVFVFLVWLGLSYVFFFSPNNKQVMMFALEGKQGSASGVFNTVMNLGMVIGVALFEVVFSQSLPAKAAAESMSAIPVDFLLGGFRNAYLLGGLVCALALFCSLMVRQQKEA